MVGVSSPNGVTSCLSKLGAPAWFYSEGHNEAVTVNILTRDTRVTRKLPKPRAPEEASPLLATLHSFPRIYRNNTENQITRDRHPSGMIRRVLRHTVPNTRYEKVRPRMQIQQDLLSYTSHPHFYPTGIFTSHFFYPSNTRCAVGCSE